jgi:Predicted dienelactone hydrolase
VPNRNHRLAARALPSKFTELFQHWSDAGFAVVAPQFPITYTGASAGPLARAGDYSQQPADLTFVLDHVLRSKWKSRLDPNRIGAAGLSLGGATIWGYIGNSCCRDRRVKAAIVMDGIQFPFEGGKIQPNRVPLLMFHADHDYSLPFASARTAYANAAPPKYFVTIFGAVHAEPYENTPTASDAMVMRTSTLFWRAYLLDQKIVPGEILTAATSPGISAAEYGPPNS